MENGEHLISLKIYEGPILSFNSSSDFIQFLEEEKSAWGSLQQYETVAESIRNNIVSTQLSYYNELIITIKNFGSHTYKAEEIGPLLSQITTAIKDRRLCSASPRDAVVLKLVNTDPDAAIVGAAARMRSIDILDPSYCAPRMKGFMIDAVARYCIAAELENYRFVLDSAQKAKADLEKLGQMSSEQSERFEKNKNQIDHDFSRLRSDFLTHLTLDEPSKFWSTRATEARKAGNNWFIAFIAINIILLFGILYFSYAERALLIKLVTTDLKFAVFPIIISAALPIFWIQRQLLKRYQDNIADSRDAQLRSVMAKSFLALTKVPEAEVGTSERGIVLQALYRPSNAQPADDSVPHPLVDILAEMKKIGNKG